MAVMSGSSCEILVRMQNIISRTLLNGDNSTVEWLMQFKLRREMKVKHFFSSLLLPAIFLVALRTYRTQFSYVPMLCCLLWPCTPPSLLFHRWHWFMILKLYGIRTEYSTLHKILQIIYKHVRNKYHTILP